MVTQGDLQFWIFIWISILTVLVIGRWTVAAGVGLVAAFALQMIILHWLAAAMYVLPWYWNLDVAVVFEGLKQSTYAIGGFTLGVLTITAMHRRSSVLTTLNLPSRIVDPRMIKLYLGVGAVSYFVLAPFFAGLSTVSAVINTASSCAIVGVVLACWNADHGKHRSQLWGWIAVAGLLPFVTIAVQGFIGYGLAASVVIFAFVGSFYRPAYKTVVVSLLAAYIGMSLYVTYMRDREDIRQVVWGGESASARVGRLRDTFTNLELFDINNVDHLQRVDMRMNQNYLVGMAVQNLNYHPEEFAHGETIWAALLAPIPRSLWPNKPTAGSGDLVTRFTGIPFGEGTSVGIGQVMELYVNFATPGVFFGFVILGGLIAYIDARAAQYRDAGDWHHFTLWFLPGLALLQLGGSLIEVTSTAVAAIVVALTLRRFAGEPARIFRPVPIPPDRVSYGRPFPVRRN